MRKRSVSSNPGSETAQNTLILRHDIHVETVPIDQLRLSKYGARSHDQAQIEQIGKSLEHFGQIIPIVIDKDNSVVCGHGRVQAAEFMGFKTLQVTRADHLTEAELRAYAIADNRLAENSKWDDERLAIEIKYLFDAELKCEISFPVEVTGFSSPQIEKIMDDEKDNPEKDQDDTVLLRDGPVITKLGDIWRLDKHRIICGDARSGKVYSRLVRSDQVSLISTDPPYNVRIKGFVSGNGAVKHDDFVMAAGEMSTSEFTDFLRQALGNACALLGDGGFIYVFMDWRHIRELQEAAQQLNLIQLNLAVWDKGVGGMGSLYRSQHELVFIFRKGDAEHVNNIQLGKFGRNRTNVWSYPSANSTRQGREALKDHPTPKPISMIADLIKDTTKVNDIVLDCFLGGGSTLIAAERTKRRCYGIELDPRYVDACIRRWQKLTGKDAVHAISKQTFNSIEKEGETAQGHSENEVRHG